MDAESLYEVDRIAAERQGPAGRREYLVQWKGYGRDGDTWEPEENMVDCDEALHDFRVWQAARAGGAPPGPAEPQLDAGDHRRPPPAAPAAGALPSSRERAAAEWQNVEAKAAWKVAVPGAPPQASGGRAGPKTPREPGPEARAAALPLDWGLPPAAPRAPSTRLKERARSCTGLRIRLRMCDPEPECEPAAGAGPGPGPWRSASVDSGWSPRKAPAAHEPYGPRGKQAAATLARFVWRKAEGRPSYRDIVVRKHEAFTHVILFSRSSERNCLHPGVMKEMQSALARAAGDDSRFVLLGAAGSAFCGGLDLAYLSRNLREDPERESLRIAECLKSFVSHIIQFSKPLVVAVNGPAQGLGVALLALCDIVWSSDVAWFQTPYIDQGQTPDGCASVTLPKIMGGAAASEMFFTARKLTAQEACDRGLVSQVFQQKEFYRIVLSRARKLAASYPLILEECKSLMRCGTKAELEKANARECDVLKNTWAFSPIVPPMISVLPEYGTQKRAQNDTLSLY